jgi:hypothetical protein
MKLAGTHRARVARPARLAAPRAEQRRFNHVLVTADFEREDGRQWSNVGGGETISEALASARADLGADWEIVRWNHAYGV